jgi:hypothetical protein
MGQRIYKSKKKSLNNRQNLKKAGLILVALVTLLFLLEVTNTTHMLHKQKAETPVISAAGTLDKGMASSSNPSSQSQNQTTDNPKSSGSNSATPPSQTGTSPPKAPYGNFVSNHSPGKNGSPTYEQSACNTTPGANCTITFSKDSISKSLPAKIVDSNGSVIWGWTPSQIGLSSGSWKITATATLNGQPVSTDDQIPLEVQ